MGVNRCCTENVIENDPICDKENSDINTGFKYYIFAYNGCDTDSMSVSYNSIEEAKTK